MVSEPKSSFGGFEEPVPDGGFAEALNAHQAWQPSVSLGNRCATTLSSGIPGSDSWNPVWSCLWRVCV